MTSFIGKLTLGAARRLSALRPLLLSLVLLTGGAALTFAVGRQVPVGDWLLLRYGAYWLALIAFISGSLSLGSVTLKYAVRGSQWLSVSERLTLAFPLGVLFWGLITFLCGLLHLFGTAFFFALPLVATVVGVRSMRSDVRRFARAQRWLWRSRPLQARTLPLLALGFLVLVAVYLLVMTPANVQFDAHWKHMALSEEWSITGGIRRFPEGRTFGTRPHFSSFLYLWAFVAPHSLLFDRMVLAAHLEFAIFAWAAFFGIPSLVRRLVPKADPRLIWVARCVFPGFLLYDSSLSGGADHIAASFGLAIALTLVRLLGKLDWRRTLPFAAMLAAAVLTKETAGILLVPIPILAVGLQCLRQAWRHRRHLSHAPAWWQVPVVAGATALLLTSPMWLLNLLWHGNPLYPGLFQYFHPRPWAADAGYLMKYGYEESMWGYHFDGPGILKGLEVLLTWSFIPHDWVQFHGAIPTFGSLFTIAVFALLFLRGTKKLWLLVLWVHAGIFAWFFTHHQDRYLQALTPLMAAVTAATAVLLWQQVGKWVRALCVALVALQMLVCADIYFIPTHTMSGLPIRKAIDLFSASWKKDFVARFAVHPRWDAIAGATPPKARVLMHETMDHLGVGREVVLDRTTDQYGLSYGRLGTPDEVQRSIGATGATHVYWNAETAGLDSLAGDLMFAWWLKYYTANRRQAGRGMLADIKTTPVTPQSSFSNRVLILGCPKRGYRSGLYRIEDLRNSVYGPEARVIPVPVVVANANAEGLAQSASFILRDKDCNPPMTQTMRRDFERFWKRKGSKPAAYEILVRSRGVPQTVEQAAASPPDASNPDLETPPPLLRNTKSDDEEDDEAPTR